MGWYQPLPWSVHPDIGVWTSATDCVRHHGTTDQDATLALPLGQAGSLPLSIAFTHFHTDMGRAEFLYCPNPQNSTNSKPEKEVTVSPLLADPGQRLLGDSRRRFQLQLLLEVTQDPQVDQASFPPS